MGGGVGGRHGWSLPEEGSGPSSGLLFRMNAVPNLSLTPTIQNSRKFYFLPVSVDGIRCLVTGQLEPVRDGTAVLSFSHHLSVLLFRLLF